MATRLSRLLSRATAALILLLAGAAPAATPLGNGHGINMPAAVWGKRAGKDSPSVYQLQSTGHSPRLVTQVKAAGFGFVRIAATPLPLMTTDSAARDRALAFLGGLIDDYRAVGIGVIIDLHFWPTDAPLHQDTVVPDPVERGRLIQAQVVLARYLAARGDSQIAFELVNEPPCNFGGKPFDWPSVQRTMVTRVRAVAPRLPLVLTACRGLPRETVKLDARPYARDPNIFWTIHYYDPPAFVGQEGDGLRNVPFPPAPASARSRAAEAAMLPPEGAPRRSYLSWQLNDYLSNNRGAATIRADMASVNAWARRQGIAPSRVFVGEFGTGFSRNAPESWRDDQLRWLQAVREEASGQGFAWCFWALPSPGGYNYDAATGFLRSDVLRAFGLKSPQ